MTASPHNAENGSQVSVQRRRNGLIEETLIAFVTKFHTNENRWSDTRDKWADKHCQNGHEDSGGQNCLIDGGVDCVPYTNGAHICAEMKGDDWFVCQTVFKSCLHFSAVLRDELWYRHNFAQRTAWVFMCSKLRHEISEPGREGKISDRSEALRMMVASWHTKHTIHGWCQTERKSKSTISWWSDRMAWQKVATFGSKSILRSLKCLSLLRYHCRWNRSASFWLDTTAKTLNVQWNCLRRKPRECKLTS